MGNLQINPLQYGLGKASPQFGGGIKPETRLTQGQSVQHKPFDTNSLARFDFRAPVVNDGAGISESGIGNRLNYFA